MVFKFVSSCKLISSYCFCRKSLETHQKNQDLNACFKVYSRFQLIQNLMNQSVGRAFMTAFYCFLSFGIFVLISYYHILAVSAFVFTIGCVYINLSFIMCVFTLASRVSIQADSLQIQLSKIPFPVL